MKTWQLVGLLICGLAIVAVCSIAEGDQPFPMLIGAIVIGFSTSSLLKRRYNVPQPQDNDSERD